MRRPDLDCVVIPAAGLGRRFGPGERDKSQMRIGDEPLLAHIVRFWRSLAGQDIRFVLVTRSAFVGEARKTMETLGAAAEYCFQEVAGGVASAIELARPHLRGVFSVHLGDCYVRGSMAMPQGPLQPGFGIWLNAPPEAVAANYGVRMEAAGRPTIVEKPETGLDRFQCGMGVYFFDGGIFDIIGRMRGHGGIPLDITPLLIHAVESGCRLRPYEFEGVYINVNRPEDLVLRG